MKWPFLIVICTQLMFTASDLIARANMSKHGFTPATFLSVWFLIYFTIRTVAMFGQLYIFSSIQLGKTMALFGATSIILSNLLGYFVLNEILSLGAYIGVSLAVSAFLVIALV